MMKYVVLGDTDIFNAIKNNEENILWMHITNSSDFFSQNDADAYFDLRDNATADYNKIAKPVFINNMVNTLTHFQYNKNIRRVNAWPGFIEKELWEIAGEMDAEAAAILKRMNKKFITVQDEPGFVSARIVAMIINEAYFAKDEAVSTEDEIDIAMRLGTNYPYGPFEWCRKIGIQKVYALLQKIAEKDTRFGAAMGLETAYKNL